MLYYERVRNEDKPSVPVWSTSHSRATTTTDDGYDNDDDLGDIDDDDNSGQQENTRTLHHSQQDVAPKCELGLVVDDEMEEVPVIKARVVRSVSLGAGDDFEDASVSVEGARERERDGDEGPDSEARLSRSRSSSPTLAKPKHVKVEPPVELLPTSSVSTEAPSPIPDAPAVDEPPIGAVPQSVGLRA
jgi:hypothetical protein